MQSTSFPRLFTQELKAIARGRFLLWGAAAFAAFLCFVAAVPATDGPNGVKDFVLTSAFILPQIMGFLAAATFAADRTNGFLDSVLTTPVRAATFFFARVAAMLAGSLVVLAAWIPFGVVIELAVGLPPFFQKLLVYTLGMALWSVIVGTLLGVALANRGPGAAVGVLGGATLVAALWTLPVHRIRLGEPLSATHEFSLFLAHLSPHVLLFEAVGLPISGVLGKNPALAALGFLLEIALTMLLAQQLYVRHHVPARWKRTRIRRWGLVTAAATLLLLAPTVAGAEYQAAPEVPVEQRKSSVQFSQMIAGVLLPPGAKLPSDAFHPMYPAIHPTPVPAETPTARDLVILLPIRHDQRVSELRIDVRPAYGMTITGLPIHRLLATATEAGTLPSDRSFEGIPAGTPLFAFRTRVYVTIHDLEGLTGEWFFSELLVKYTLDGESRAESTALPLSGMVPGARLMMMGAGLPALLAPAGAAVLRSRRTRGG